MSQAQLYQGTWEQIAQAAQTHRGRKNLTLIVPLDEETANSTVSAEQEAARVASICDPVRRNANSV